ncbi:DUF905 family protein [Pantoea stewartii]|uniref:Uncharacterized protein n=1 Tax=Pantoea stewartii subsp. stewartii DC283 TaxID=660596 RepID=H3RLK0_PANSE|nr:DUF905 family protein [Pantoea stewartii]ARF52759.1 hypothetical protein DSJ_26480 [Pantoea stewartii subsp. stewartii DC283]EHT97713.1 hypothetical protein CKS_5574 [Pantoea stewartii subsp. stewartii DC283]KAB0554007.1 DUF905 domain-containing protein [Pantoea stewartii subsp. stewartii]
MNDVTRALINAYLLKQGYTAQESASSRSGSQIEVRHNGHLVWRAWEFEEGFADSLERYLKEFAVSGDTRADVVEKIKKQIAINNEAFAASRDSAEQERLSYASTVLGEMIRRIEGFPPNDRIMPYKRHA